MDDKKLLNGKFTFKRCCAKEASFTVVWKCQQAAGYMLYCRFEFKHSKDRFMYVNALITEMYYVNTSAVKRLKYLIAINRIYVIVNSKWIAINRTFLSILNVPSFIFFHHIFHFNALINMEKWIGLLYANVLFYWKTTLPNRAKIKL